MINVYLTLLARLTLLLARLCRRESGEHRFAEESIRFGGEDEGAEEEGGGEAEAEAVLHAEACHVLLGSRLALLSEAAAPHPDLEDCCE